MRDSAIRHLVGCDDSPLIAAALFESTVQIWHLEKAEKIGEFETILDFGGQRLALAAAGSICVTGSWTQGLSAYSVPDGKRLWHRADLSEIQTLTVDAAGQVVYCGLERGPLAVIDVNTGTTSGTMRGALRVVPSRFGPGTLIVRRERYRIEGTRSFEIPPMSFALVGAALSPDAVCISEPKAGVRCIDLASGDHLWHHPELHVGEVTFAASDHNFYCVSRVESAPLQCSLIRLAPGLLDCDKVAQIGVCWEETFAQAGESLVTMRGDVYETSTGRLLTRLEFPQRDYPDR
jgi:hypothetical protein